MTEAEWLTGYDPKMLLEQVRKTASSRKLCLLSLARHERLLPIVAGDIDPYEAFNSAADFDDPLPTILKVREQFSDYWVFDGTAWGFAELLTKSTTSGPDRVAAPLVRDIFGNHFRPVFADPAWLTPTVVSIADAIYQERAFDRLPILADALEDAGCTNADVLLHCRQPGEHVRGCWVVDLVLGKE